MEVKMNKLYTLGEEIFNSVSHGIGAGISVAGCTLMIIKAAFTGSPMKVVSASIFGAALIILYMMSTLYHALTNSKAKAVMRIFDHCTIFFLIAGTYTPFTLVAMGGALGWVMFGILWGSCAIGILLNAISLKRFEKLSMVLYILMGWCVVFCVKPVVAYLGLWGTVMLLAGGIFYTAGIIFYAKRKKYMHSIFHLFILLGSILQFFCILLYVV